MFLQIFFKDGNPIKANKRIVKNSTDLILTEASKEDFGIYQCLAHGGRSMIIKPEYAVQFSSFIHLNEDNNNKFIIIGVCLGLVFISALIIYYIIRRKQIKVCGLFIIRSKRFTIDFIYHTYSFLHYLYMFS